MTSQLIELANLDSSTRDEIHTLQGMVVIRKTSLTRLLGPDNSTADGLPLKQDQRSQKLTLRKTKASKK